MNALVFNRFHRLDALWHEHDRLRDKGGPETSVGSHSDKWGRQPEFSVWRGLQVDAVLQFWRLWNSAVSEQESLE